MAVRLETELTESQKAAMAAIPATSWFTQFVYQNAESPVHPNRSLAENNQIKQEMIKDWLVKAVKGKRVLDLFCANGGFSLIAALAGAKEVIGVEYAEDRLSCARFVASTVKSDCRIDFKQGDVYKITTYFDEPFDVVLCLGGLYHIADPAFVLKQIVSLTKECMILQTSQVLSVPGNWAKFKVRRRDQSKEGMTSIRAGYGVWYFTPGCLRELLNYGGFEIIEERQPPVAKRRRFPWYLARCKPL